MNILVTGGAGFIGSHVVKSLLEHGHKVSVIDNMVHGNSSNLPDEVNIYKYDISEAEIENAFKIERPEVVIHNAAQISVADSVKDPLYDAKVNVLGSINILEMCRKYAVRKVIYPASAAIFGEPKYLPIDEKHPLNMISSYGVSKHTVEHYLNVYKKLYNINYTVLRYSNVYGPGQDSSGEGGVVSIFAEKLTKGEPLCIYGNGNQIRDFVYVKDVTEANILALNSLDNDIYNVSTNTKTTINDLAKLMCEAYGKEVEIMHKGERAGDIFESYMSYDKIYNACGWKPKYDLKLGIKETIQSF
ncbi:UDP-glucose 4-epimerase [Clostridium acetobutylicum]|uniref:UDP-glucose 4-epimerase n=1 Tax=Clostridium acetobutylicum (strain ATCC 824 / DSM 792 / JCM 1419 / IAM 19013 / LMG 5710 / NBRC 13948 / NRRL B-527 / VKM B-1787 / 2291 / W) TaxID=272562 RepID=Q97GN2_CLOAB|nr:MULTISPECIES: NAD-dependent epimerase/dehydratase family protein [Clostridium]AAK80290.1 UDP-glucose 4-epimerase [Clostridium acetobutylicum ATCC 824]ADZ21385.1 UDP-glucose 4-epimerase [Clostridium acetobutylicum EA 2018]AEI34352.1 UDP-glucose 4-epimerase [Clostridium acetobutylicum DSM 1731]AWV79288.1 UDP-glucose 4-epimerase [Clostridium acetobutylicum]MBC2394742.1 NAD-dependent epimerase/dehydratase family protein [Clostridium acetobutylicum]